MKSLQSIALAMMIIGSGVSAYVVVSSAETSSSSTVLPTLEDAVTNALIGYEVLPKPSQRKFGEELVKICNEGGLEVEKAGLHLLAPGEITGMDGDSWPTFDRFTFNDSFGFWGLPGEPTIDYFPNPDDARNEDGEAWVSFNRILKNAAFSFDVVLDDFGTYGISCVMPQTTRGQVTSFVTRKREEYSDKYVDWFGRAFDNSESTRTSLMIALVADNRAYLPVDLYAIASGGAGAVDFLLATGLSYEAAEAIVDRLR